MTAASTENPRFARAIARFDAANAEDPRRERTESGDEPKELVYAQRMTSWLERIEPGASEALRLAARAQHLCRWRVPRGDYPEGRQGYLRWRRDCAELHAGIATGILREVGYGQTTVERVAFLLRKQGLPDDPEALALEDTACLVFLEHELAGFAPKHDEPKLVRILERTWRKMSPRGQRAALALELPAPARELLEKALSRRDHR
ncbi:MAG TPA: DUF4202 domain-containing protein [Thermoanaerobaculia bacterium]|nr:DUF4202 domain-containing protein [Thermoanaerobaculia bacterium]